MPPADEEVGLFLPAGRRIGSCMTHRPEIVWLDSNLKKSEILALVNRYPEYGSFPVCSGTVDSVLGVLPVRSFLLSLAGQEAWPGLKALVRKPVYVPETVTILRVLSLLEESDCTMAFVIDEYGGIEGLVTRNGLIGELLKEISPEGELPGPDIFQREDKSWLIGGQVRMEEIRELVALPEADAHNREYYTLAGYLLSRNGSIPRTGDRIRAGEFVCEIVDMDGHRIDKALVSRDSLAAPEKAADAGSEAGK